MQTQKTWKRKLCCVREELEEMVGKREASGHLFLDCCPHDPDPDKQQKMDGWMNGWIYKYFWYYYHNSKQGFFLQLHSETKTNAGGCVTTQVSQCFGKCHIKSLICMNFLTGNNDALVAATWALFTPYISLHFGKYWMDWQLSAKCFDSEDVWLQANCCSTSLFYFGCAALL